MNLAVTFPDPETAAVLYLRSAFTGRPESYVPAAADIDVTFPTRTLDGETAIQVELENGGSDDYPVTERAVLRFTCYADRDSRSTVKDLASLTQALVLSQPGSAEVAGVRPGVGRSDVIEDPDTENLMVWFTARVSLKATLLAS